MSTDALAGFEVTRTIPVPISVSPEAQRFLAAGPLMQSRGVVNPSRDDLDGWRAHLAAMNEMVLAAFEARVAGVPAKVETRRIDDVPVFIVTPEGVGDDADQPIYLDLHGGAFVTGGGACCRAMAILSATRVRMRVWSVDYRMPVDHPYPAALDDCMTVYRALLEEQSPDEIIVGGASAGGNLAAALALRALDEGLPPPAGLVLLSPATDLTESGDTFQTNFGIDMALSRRVDDLLWLYARDHDLADPYVSPLFGDFTPAFPPTLLQSGTRDLLLSSTVRMHRRLREAGVEAELHVFEAMPHGGFWGAPEDQEVADEVRRFIASRVATRG